MLLATEREREREWKQYSEDAFTDKKELSENIEEGVKNAKILG